MNPWLSVLVVTVLVSSTTSPAQAVEELPVAAALVDGENSDLGEDQLRFPFRGRLLMYILLLGEHPWHVGLVREESKTGFLGWVRHLGGLDYYRF